MISPSSVIETKLKVFLNSESNMSDGILKELVVRRTCARCVVLPSFLNGDIVLFWSFFLFLVAKINTLLCIRFFVPLVRVIP